MSEEIEECLWIFDGNHSYDTSCDDGFACIYDKPDFIFCPYCGKKIKEEERGET